MIPRAVSAPAPGNPSRASLQRRDFHYDLPPELIALEPAEVRDHSRLLQLTASGCRHLRFDQLPELLRPEDLLVINDTAVIKARLIGVKDSGGRAELLVERLEAADVALCQVKVSKPLKPGREVRLEDDVVVHVLERQGQFYRCRFSRPVMDVLDALGDVPLPPYIDRGTTISDLERYQTVYHREAGAVAAPTAGLHFTDALLARIRASGCQVAGLTLHVGAGTFQPLRVQRLEDHKMHSERFRVPAETLAAVRATRARGGRVVAVGTTVVRALEAADEERGDDGWQETALFITPGYRFRRVDALITNFHLPESTLLMLVAAFGGVNRVMDAYRLAVRERYRFFSYGDAMFLERSEETGP